MTPAKVYVVTDPERGWNCVLGVYTAVSEKELNEFLLHEEGYTEAPDWWADCRRIHEKEHIINVRKDNE